MSDNTNKFTPMKKVTETRTKEEQNILDLFGKNLRAIREQKEISQETLAFEAGFSRSYYTEVETGKRNISLLNIVKLATALQIELDKLIKVSSIEKNGKEKRSKKS